MVQVVLCTGLDDNTSNAGKKILVWHPVSNRRYSEGSKLYLLEIEAANKNLRWLHIQDSTLNTCFAIIWVLFLKWENSADTVILYA